jgi:hypothetical protein
LKTIISLVFPTLLLVVLLTSCTQRYYADGVFGGPSVNALARQDEIYPDALDKIAPTNSPIHGSTLILLPSRDEIHKNYTYVGEPYRGGPLYVGREKIDKVVALISNYLQYMADAIKKRKLFDSVHIELYNGNTVSYPVGNYDYLIFFDVDGWFIRDKNSPVPLPVPFMKTISVDTSLTISYLDSLSQQATSLLSRRPGN